MYCQFKNNPYICRRKAVSSVYAKNLKNNLICYTLKEEKHSSVSNVATSLRPSTRRAASDLAPIFRLVRSAIVCLLRKKTTFPLKTTLITFFLLCLSLFSCNKNNNTEDFRITPVTAMEQFLRLSPIEGAKFYKEQRSIYPFLDNLYGDSIVPALIYCNYYELKSICEWLKGTPYHNTVLQLYQDIKSEYEQSIYEEIEERIKKEQHVFKSCILPAIELEVDSMLERDIKKTMNKYAGGFLNYKKMNFLIGRGRNDFKRMFWEDFDLEKYRVHISKHIQTYLDTISKRQNYYCKEITGITYEERILMDTPELKIGLSKSTLKHIQNYTKNQSDKILTDIVKDWITPAVLAGVSGGVSTIYDIGTFAYDIKVTIDDIKNEKIDPDDMVKYVCNHDLSYQIDNYYLNLCLEKVNVLIIESNHKLYNKIITQL